MEIRESENGLFLTWEEPEVDGVIGVRIIPLAALVTWSELLGVEDLAEVLDVILAAQDPGVIDHATGQNAWTDPYTLLGHREQAREQEAAKAVQEGTADDPRSPLLRATLAAYNAVHQPINGGECAMDRCRRDARETLAVGDMEPTGRTKASSRLPRTELLRCETGTHAEKLRELLEPYSAQVELMRREFLHSLAGGAVNPLDDTSPVELDYDVAERDPSAATLRKYGINPYSEES